MTGWQDRARGLLTGPFLALVGGWGACALTLLEPRRPSLFLAGLGAAAVVAALVTGWRIVGSLAVALVASAPLMAGILEDAATGVGRLVAATALVVLLVLGLDGTERLHDRRRRRPGGRVAVWLQRRPGKLVAPAPTDVRHRDVATVAPVAGLAARAGALVAAFGATAAVATLAGAPVGPSVPLVLLGLGCGVAAVLLADRLH
jgi:hypothetical protein